MSGDNHHYLPQHLQRGFAAVRKGKTTRVWCYRGEGAPRLTATGKIGARDRFYSASGDQTMTRYENGPFNLLLTRVRSIPPGGRADPNDAAELVSHLVFRNAHLRDGMKFAARKMATAAAGWADDPDWVRRMLGLDSVRPTARFRAHLERAFDKDGRMKALPVPREAFEDVAFSLVRERFGGLWADTRSEMRTWAIGLLGASQGALMGDLHNEALEQNLHPEGVARQLAALDWSVVAAETSAVLPDCVALSFDAEGVGAPLMMAGADRPLVAMPLAADRFLVGRANGASELSLHLWNLHAAACSAEFFVAAVDTPELRRHSRYVGVRAWSGIDATLEAAQQDLERRTSPEDDAPPLLAPLWPVAVPSTSDGRVSVTFNGLDGEHVQAIGQALSILIGDHLEMEDLGRLDAITFAREFGAAARALDRGVEGAAAEARVVPYGTQVSLTPLVLRDGVIQTHLLFMADIGRALVADDPGVRDAARHVVAGGLAWVKILRMREAAFPGAVASVLSDRLDHQRLGPASGGWQAYFAARLSASAWPDADSQQRSLLLSALDTLQTALPAHRLDYRFHGDAEQLGTQALALAGEVLVHAGAWLGHRAQTGRPCLPEQDDELLGALRAADLVYWFDLYRADLEAFWERREAWESFDEFLAFNLHVDRLLWPHGLIFSRTEEGHSWLHVPLASDEARLPGEALKRWGLSLRRRIARLFAGPKAGSAMRGRSNS